MIYLCCVIVTFCAENFRNGVFILQCRDFIHFRRIIMIITKFETWWVTRDKCLFDEKRQGGAKMGWDVFAIRLTADDGTEGIATCMAARSGGVTESYLHDSIAPILLGRDPHDHEAIFYELWNVVTKHFSPYFFRVRWMSHFGICVQRQPVFRFINISALTAQSFRYMPVEISTPLCRNMSTKHFIIRAKGF